MLVYQRVYANTNVMPLLQMALTLGGIAFQNITEKHPGKRTAKLVFNQQKTNIRCGQGISAKKRIYVEYVSVGQRFRRFGSCNS